MTKLTTPSVLAFESKLACSDAVMFSGNWENRGIKEHWKAIKITEKSVRGTISNRLTGAQASKIDAKIENANLQTVDNASLPFDSDTLKLTFTLRVLGDLALPSTCNNPEYQTALAEKIAAYTEQHGFKELATRYATNLANGRFLWRNRVGAEQVEIHIQHNDQQWIFDGHKMPLKTFDQNNEKLTQVAAIIEQGLLGEKATLLTIDAYVQLGEAQTVFPSQELVMNVDDKKSKFLYQLDGQAALHSQKIGNALRTIDTWYPQIAEHGPIAIEPYGSVTNRGTVYRHPKEKTDFYNILDNWLLKDKIPELNEQHYLMAMLIRGGVFGG